MRAYIIRRLLLAIPTLLLVTIIVFFLLRFIPGDVMELMVAEMAIESGMGAELTIEYLEEAMGLDMPVHIQYGRWLGVVPQADGAFSGIVQGNLGESLWSAESVRDDILRRIPITAELGFFALIVGLIWGIPIGTFSAIRQDTASDYIGRTIAILCISLPSFWVATMVMVYPSIWWNWTPPIEYIPLVRDPIGNLGQFILPAFIMGMLMSGTTMRMTRTMMLEVLRQDYIRTAWSKGLTERTVIVRHALKNALIPVVTIVGMMVPMLIGGLVVIEQIFCLPGMGRLMIEALNKRDYPVVSGINVMLACVILVVNLVVDLTYGYLDPRVHYK